MRLRLEDRLKRFYCYLDLELCLITRMERFHAVDQHLCKFTGTKRKPVCIKKKTILELQHVRRFIVLEDQYGRRDVM